MIEDIKKHFQIGINELLEDFLLEKDPIRVLERLGDFTGAVGDLRIRVTMEHLDPKELTPEQQISAVNRIMERLDDLEDLGSL